MVTKQALVAEMLDFMERSAPLFGVCRKALYDSGRPIVERAQSRARRARGRDCQDIIQIVLGIAKIPASEPGQIDRIIEIALDGLRYRAS